MRLSETSSIAKLKVRTDDATMFTMISGRVIFDSVSEIFAPCTRADSSRTTGTCAIPYATPAEYPYSGGMRNKVQRLIKLTFPIIFHIQSECQSKTRDDGSFS